MYRRFGSEVTIVEMGLRLIQREDEDVSEAVRTILENEGINIRLSAECVALEKHSDKIAVNVDCSSGDKRVVGSHVLLAVGRVPNTEDLGLENAGIVVDQRGYIQVDDQLRTNVPASTPSAIATGEELSLTPLTTIMRSSQRTFWTVIPGA
jgi:pyruvate/2-oxoglutarate dehydrogenase complex dihydrolipoamide dehydrogenase (E3) component